MCVIELYKGIYTNRRLQVVTSENRLQTSNRDNLLQNEAFKSTVRFCLDWLGYDLTMGNFRRLDSQLAWTELAKNIQNRPAPGYSCDAELVCRDFPGKETR